MDTKALPLDAADGGRVDLYGRTAGTDTERGTTTDIGLVSTATDRSSDIVKMSPSSLQLLNAKLYADAIPTGDRPAPTSAPVSKAAEASPPPEQSLLGKLADNTWVQVNGASYHFDRSKHFNERNYGLGLMYKISDDKAVAIGQYENSIRQKSHYAYFDYEPLKMGPVRAGILAGVVDGYYFNKGGPIPMVLPTASIEGKHFGVSAFYIPPMPQISSVIGLQARFKIN